MISKTLKESSALEKSEYVYVTFT